ncbi:MAG: OB-fold putative lipoprotein, partial [Gemmataceae bacterium]|nr:OB-fold putative lipoprotein [Gemmataceae bacterium]
DGGRTSERSKETSVLGVVALVLGVKALLFSLIPCVGMFAIVFGSAALLLSLVSLVTARHSRQGMGFPVSATAVSGSAVGFSLMWLAMAGAVFNGDRTAQRPAPVPFQPAPVQPVPQANPRAPAPKPVPQPQPVDDDRAEKQLLEQLRQDRLKEEIRNGPGLAVTAETLVADFRANVVSAELSYKDRVLAVNGTVVRVGGDGKTTFVLELEAGADANPIACEFTAQNKFHLAPLKPGQSVKVRGLCAGPVNEVITLKDCVVAK